MASPSCAPPPACVLLPPTAGESTVIGAPFSPLLPSRCHPIPQPPPQEQRGVSASGCGDGVRQVLEKAREGRLEQGHQHKLLQGTEYYLYEINVFSIMRRKLHHLFVW